MSISRHRKTGGIRSAGPVSRKVVEQVKRAVARGRFDLSSIDDSGFERFDYRSAAAADKRHSDIDPLHALYSRANDRLVDIIEPMIEIAPELEKLVKPYTEVFDIYEPGYPPMGPVTTSYSACWSHFDLCTRGARPETLGTVAIDVSRALGLNLALIAVFELMQATRPGIYRHEGIADGRANLRELVTGKTLSVISPSGHLGQIGEIWLARIMPVAFPDDPTLHPITFTTPYLLGKNGPQDRYLVDTESDWLGFFDRALSTSRFENQQAAYEHFMKYGPAPYYWFEYIHCAYRNHRKEVIFLEGLPDQLDSMPHGDQAKPWLSKLAKS